MNAIRMSADIQEPNSAVLQSPIPVNPIDAVKRLRNGIAELCYAKGSNEGLEMFDHGCEVLFDRPTCDAIGVQSTDPLPVDDILANFAEAAKAPDGGEEADTMIAMSLSRLRKLAKCTTEEVTKFRRLPLNQKNRATIRQFIASREALPIGACGQPDRDAEQAETDRLASWAMGRTK